MRFIYLHGFASGPGTQKGQFFKQQLSKEGIQLLIPDLTEGNFTHTTISKQLNVVGRLVQESSEPVVFIGSSMGGFLAALAAEKFPLVAGIFLLAPGFEFYARREQMMGKMLLKQWEKEGYINVYHYYLKKEVPIHFEFVQDARKYHAVRFERALPAMIIHGLKDEVVPYQVSINYLRQNKQAQCVLLPGDHGLLNHLPLIWNYFQLFLGQIPAYR